LELFDHQPAAFAGSRFQRFHLKCMAPALGTDSLASSFLRSIASISHSSPRLYAYRAAPEWLARAPRCLSLGSSAKRIAWNSWSPERGPKAERMFGSSRPHPAESISFTTTCRAYAGGLRRDPLSGLGLDPFLCV